MRQSILFTKTRREAPKDEVSKNATLLIRAGFINKERGGIYDYLPLGLRVLKNLQDIIRKEMDSIGGQEILMSTLQRPEIWKTTNRWDDEVINIWFKTQISEGSELGMAFTHEEPVTNMMEQFIPSYQDLPKYVYQFQTKFRKETRVKSGLLRGLEFLMKDLYSFSATEADHNVFYDKVKEAYRQIFNSVGIGDKTYFTRASGGSFSKFSHEFQTICDAGEDLIYLSQASDTAINQEIWDMPEALEGIKIQKKDFAPQKSIEVGNIFSLGTKFSHPLLCRFKDNNGQAQSPVMGSYGIGVGRLMGTIVEVLSDDKGIVWPENVAPFKIHLIVIPGGEKVREYADRLYKELEARGVETLYDDRDLRAGEKFQDSDLIGIPTRVIISEKTLESGRLEMKDRRTGETKMISEEELLNK